MVGKSKRQASDGEEQEAGKWWGRARDRQVIGGKQETTKWLSSARDRRVMEKTERQASDRGD